MCIRVLTIFKCACPHRNTLVCPHHIHVREPSSTASSDLSSKPTSPSRPTTSSSEAPEKSPENTISNDTNDDDDDFQKNFTPRLPSALQGHKAWTPLPGKENQRWEHCPGYLAKTRALSLATSAAAGAGGKSRPGSGSGASGAGGAGEREGMMGMGKETQCAEYKATEPKFRRRWEVKSGVCEECRGMHGMDGPSTEDGRDGEKGKEGGKERGMGMGRGMGKGEERGRARSRAATDPTMSAVPVPGLVDGGNMVKGVSAKVVGRMVVRKRIATL